MLTRETQAKWLALGWLAGSTFEPLPPQNPDRALPSSTTGQSGATVLPRLSYGMAACVTGI